MANMHKRMLSSVFSSVFQMPESDSFTPLDSNAGCRKGCNKSSIETPCNRWQAKDLPLDVLGVTGVISNLENEGAA